MSPSPKMKNPQNTDQEEDTGEGKSDSCVSLLDTGGKNSKDRLIISIYRKEQDQKQSNDQTALVL